MASDQPSIHLIDAGLMIGEAELLKPISLQVGPGECVAIVGPSGAGKTSLLRLMSGAERCTSGRVIVQGVDTSKAHSAQIKALRSRVGFIHQDHQLVPNYRVIQNVLTGRVGRQGLLASLLAVLFPSRDITEEIHRLLGRVGVEEKLFSWTHQLSGGERQRVAIARALFQEPQILLADEPVASVDPARAEALVVLLTKLAAEEGWALAVSLHNLALAQTHFDRVIGLRDGLVLFDARAEDVPAGAYERLYDLSGT